MPVLILLFGMFSIALMRMYLPLPAKVEGKPLGVVTLRFRERVLVQRTNLYLIGGVILIGAVGGYLSGPIELVAIFATLGLLLIPSRYTLTSDGIAFNNVVFRSWTDFSTVRHERTALVLEGLPGKRDFRVHVVGANRDAAQRAVTRLLSPAAPASARHRRARRVIHRNGVVQQ